jgi:hypothetical protein
LVTRLRQPRDDTREIALFAAPKVRTAGGIEDQPVGAVDCGDRCIADAPERQCLEQFAGQRRSVVQDYDPGHENPSVGYRHAVVYHLRLGYGICRGDQHFSMIGGSQHEGAIFQGRPAEGEPVRLQMTEPEIDKTFWHVIPFVAAADIAAGAGPAGARASAAGVDRVAMGPAAAKREFGR